LAVLHSLQTIVTFLIVLGVLVVAHEWGHFIIARLFKIRVDDFSIGFGKRLVRLGKRGDTEYNIRMLPLGGFVKIAGMEIDEAPLIQAKERMTGNKTKTDDPDADQLPLMAENTGESEPYLAPDGFNAKPLWQRSLVILAGPVMSFITGYLIFCLMGFTVGMPTDQVVNRIGEVEPGGAGQQIDLRAGDTITAINGSPITTGDQMVTQIHDSFGHRITLTVLRDGHTLTKTATPRPLKDPNTNQMLEVVSVNAAGALAGPFGLKTGDTLDGLDGTAFTGDQQAAALLRSYAGRKVTLTFFRHDQPISKQALLPSAAQIAAVGLTQHPLYGLQIAPAEDFQRVGFLESLQRGNELTGRLLMALVSLVRHGQLHKQVGGVIVMYQMTSIAIANGAAEVLFLAGQLSVSLAIFNLLPIPILDGGHLLNFLIEWVRGGKKMSEEGQQRFMLAGLAIIGTLFIWIMTKNILQVIFHQLPQ
jgi:regulator of sigma E protease